jgi:ribonuclease G
MTRSAETKAVDGLILAGGPGERRIALLHGDEVVGFVIDRFEPAAGDVILGRVLARPAGMGASFVEIGGQLPGYLPRPGEWREGEAILVQVTSEARQDKGAVLTDRFDATDELKRRAETTKPPAKLLAPGGLARTLQREQSVRRLLVEDPALLPEARKLFAKAELHPGAWQAHGAADALELALSRIVPLEKGGRLVIDETAGATVIDIDAGGLSRDAANLVAAAEIARQLRLRGIAGQILIDAIPGDSPGSINGAVERLRHYLAMDPTPTDVLGVTRMRLIELVRPRRQPSLAEYFLAPPQPRRSAESLALEALQAVLREALARPAARLTLTAAPEIMRQLDRRPDWLAETNERLGRKLQLAARAGMEGYEVSETP